MKIAPNKLDIDAALKLNEALKAQLDEANKNVELLKYKFVKSRLSKANTDKLIKSAKKLKTLENIKNIKEQEEIDAYGAYCKCQYEYFKLASEISIELKNAGHDIDSLDILDAIRRLTTN